MDVNNHSFGCFEDQVAMGLHKHKLNKKVKRMKSRPTQVGVSSLGKAARRLEILDKVLTLFGMRVGAYQTADLDIQGDVIMGVRLTVYFMEG